MKRGFILSLLCVFYTATGLARDLTRGYRGFVEVDGSFGKCDYWNDEKWTYDKDNLLFLGIATSHGYQFNPHFYLGAGLMLACAFPTGDMTIPIFADARYDAHFGRFTPFIDIRGGLYFDGGSECDLYLSPTIGYSFLRSKKLNFNLGAGITLRGDKTIKNIVENGQLVAPNVVSHRINTLFTIKFGIDLK
ncbi:MAG: hypothetical protein K2H60_00030 [Muribaculaceae bacterium]|nr:hypothetical protein [Muribaculaceae bacterium]